MIHFQLVLWTTTSLTVHIFNNNSSSYFMFSTWILPTVLIPIIPIPRHLLLLQFQLNIFNGFPLRPSRSRNSLQSTKTLPPPSLFYQALNPLHFVNTLNFYQQTVFTQTNTANFVWYRYSFY